MLNQLHAEHYGPSAKPVGTLPAPAPALEPEAVKIDPLPKVVPANHVHDEGADEAADGDAPVIRLTLPTMKAGE